MIGIHQEVMPFVRFETKSYGRNEAASIASGVHVPNTATFIIITSHGSKDSSDFIADEWLPRKRAEASRGAYNLDWVEHFEKQYKAWKEGHDLPRNGTPVLTWQAISPEQNARLRAIGYQVVEDLAALPDTSLGSIGLDGRHLRDLARAWLAEGKDKGINARAVADQAVRIETLETANEQLRTELNALKARLSEEPRKRAKEAA